MDGWMDGWVDGRTDGWTDGRMDGWTDRTSYRDAFLTDASKNHSFFGVHGRMDGPTDGHSYRVTCTQLKKRRFHRYATCSSVASLLCVNSMIVQYDFSRLEYSMTM